MVMMSNEMYKNTIKYGFNVSRMISVKFGITLTIGVLFCGVLIAVQANAAARCFQFTWLGPRFNNESVFMNATCQEATRLAQGVPCKHPLVVSYDGTWPDVEYIWTHHAQQASCVLAQNDVCAQYIYYFNGIVENSTYMCTRGVDNNGAAITSGCYEQRDGSFTTRVCFCQSVRGGVPCNHATTIALPTTLTIFLAVFSILVNKNGFIS